MFKGFGAAINERSLLLGTHGKDCSLSRFLLFSLIMLSHFSHVQLCATPSLVFSRQEHWSGLPFPSPMHKSEKWKWSHSVMSDSLRPYGLQPTRLFRPWDFPGKSTGVGCHCLKRTTANSWANTHLKYELHFPALLEASCSHVTNFYPIKYKEKCHA